MSFVSVYYFFFASTVNANEVIVKGQGLSRDQAVRDAFRAAIGQAVGALVSSEISIQNYTLVNDNIYSNSHGFIRSYDIIHEETRNEQVIVTVRVNVDTELNPKLLSKLEKVNLVDMLENPKIAVIIPEYHLNVPSPYSVGESAVLRKLIDAGFTQVVDVESVRGIRYYDRLSSVLGDRQMIAAIASDLDNDLNYLIVGESYNLYVGKLTNSTMLICHARVEAKLINVRTGAIIAIDCVNADGVDKTEFIAAKQALNNAGENMGDFMVGKLFELVSKPKNIRLIIKNMNNFSNATALEQQLRGLQGVKTVTIGSHSPAQTIMTVTFYGTEKSLSTVLEKMGNISVEEVNSDFIQASIKY